MLTNEPEKISNPKSIATFKKCSEIIIKIQIYASVEDL
jgi:hypothetical protein